MLMPFATAVCPALSTAACEANLAESTTKQATNTVAKAGAGLGLLAGALAGDAEVAAGAAAGAVEGGYEGWRQTDSLPLPRPAAAALSSPTSTRPVKRRSLP